MRDRTIINVGLQKSFDMRIPIVDLLHAAAVNIRDRELKCWKAKRYSNGKPIIISPRIETIKTI